MYWKFFQNNFFQKSKYYSIMIYPILISFILIGYISKSESELTTDIPITNGICDLVKCRNGMINITFYLKWELIKLSFLFKGGTCYYTNNLAYCKCLDGYSGM